MDGQGCEALIAPSAFLRNFLRRWRTAPAFGNAINVLLAPKLVRDRWLGKRQHSRRKALTIVLEATRRVEFDRLDWSHERPSEAETVRNGLIEIFRRHIA